MARTATVGLALAVAALLVAGAGPHGPAPAAASATDDGMHHAAIVVDTGDGQVRKMCLAFPEAELDGIEALRRVDTRPYRFETYGSKGSAVCMLCGVGCPSGDCFCDSSRYWAYFRAGPGGEPFQASRAGASSTRVQDGDVEGWKWGKGEAPPATTVGETCDVPEPPKRTAATTTTQAAAPVTTAAADPAAASSTTTPPPGSASGSVPSTPTPPTAGAGGATLATVAPVPTSTPAQDATSTTALGVADEQAAPVTDAQRGLRALGASTRTPGRTGPSGTGGSLAGAGAFVAALVALLVWRVRLRRARSAAEVRSVTPVR